MSKPQPVTSSVRTVETMIELARCSKHHRVIVAGSNAPQRMFELHRCGFNRVATTTTCGLPRGQYDVALVEWQAQSIKALETTLDWLVHFLGLASVLAIRLDDECPDHRQLRPLLERLGYRIEAGTRCGNGLVISARGREHAPIAAA